MRALLPLCMMVCGNVFMTTAWYWHLRSGAARGKPLFLIVLMSWAIALLEYSIMVPANRLGVAAGLSVAQLKVAQEVITLLVFVPFAYFVLGEKLRLDYLWAFLCLALAVYFVNRSKF
ncbi:MAG: DMT family protein [Kiritimatiellae bacterium]|nr:DMT family protein [Kiritimatiellia bacterium]